MDVNTADLGDLAAEVAALGRRVSALSGRVTALSAALHRTGAAVAGVADFARQAAEMESILRRAGMPPRPVPRHARPRHLKAVPGGRRAGTGRP